VERKAIAFVFLSKHDTAASPVTAAFVDSPVRQQDAQDFALIVSRPSISRSKKIFAQTNLPQTATSRPSSSSCRGLSVLLGL
jgi:hypothetical protein